MGDESIDRVVSLELERVLNWRRALDGLRNLSVLMLTAMITVTFGFPASGHLVLFFGSLAIFAVMIFEARTSQYADDSEQRLRDIEQNVFAPALDPSLTADPELKVRLAESIARLRPTTGFLEAMAGRVFRNYWAIFLALDSSWVSKIYLYPEPARSFGDFIHRADLGLVPGWFVLSFLIPFWGAFIAMSLWYARRHPKNLRSY